MRKYRISSILKILLFVLVVGNSVVFPHAERVHQYIAREAYKLLKKHCNNLEIPVLRDKLGFKETGNFSGQLGRGTDFQDGTICAGAFREDISDIVYGYGNGTVVTDITKWWWASVTHFWDADLGDDSPTNLTLVPYTNMPNAYQKICAYKNGYFWLSWLGTIKAQLDINGEFPQLYDINATPGVDQMHGSRLIATLHIIATKTPVLIHEVFI